MVAASSAPHIQARLTWGYPEGRCRRAAPSLLSRKMFSTVVRCRYQCSAAIACVRAGHVQVGQDEAVGVDRPGAGQLGDRQGPLVRVQGAAAPGPRVGGDLGRIQQRPGGPAAGCSPATSPGSTPRRRPGRRPCRSRRASRPRRSRPAAATAARSAWRRSRSRCARRGRRGPARRRSTRRRRAVATRPDCRARSGRPARARRSRSGAVARGSSVPSPRSAASTISVSAQAGHVRPPDPLALVVIGHAPLLPAVDLHVGGVQVDRDRPAGQRRPPAARAAGPASARSPPPGRSPPPATAPG